MRAVIDIPWSSNLYAAISFTVINRLDLNSLKPQMRRPVCLSEAKKPRGCCPFRSDPVSVKFSINKSVFVPGERIVFSVEIGNKTKQELSSVRVSLIQKTRVHAERRKKVYKKSMACLSMLQSVGSFSVEEWNASYRIPATCPTLTDPSCILKITYYFKLCIDAAEESTSSHDLRIPITIGSIPLQETSPPSKMNGWKRNIANANNPLPPNELVYTFEADNTEYDDPLPPYSYELTGEAMQSDLNSYTPFYLFYKEF